MGRNTILFRSHGRNMAGASPATTISACASRRIRVIVVAPLAGGMCDCITSVIRQQSPRVPTRYGYIYHLPNFLYPEEQVPDLLDYLGVSTRLTAWEALIGGEDKVRCTLEVENGLHAIKV